MNAIMYSAVLRTVRYLKSTDYGFIFAMIAIQERTERNTTGKRAIPLSGLHRSLLKPGTATKNGCRYSVKTIYERRTDNEKPYERTLL